MLAVNRGGRAFLGCAPGRASCRAPSQRFLSDPGEAPTSARPDLAGSNAASCTSAVAIHCRLHYKKSALDWHNGAFVKAGGPAIRPTGTLAAGAPKSSPDKVSPARTNPDAQQLVIGLSATGELARGIEYDILFGGRGHQTLTGLGGDDVLAGSLAFGAAGDLRADTAGANTNVASEMDGDSSADLAAVLRGLPSPPDTDFVL